MIRYQIGFDLFFFVLWISVKPLRFAKRVRYMIVRPPQSDNISDAELLSLFGGGGLYLRDGWRLYRSVKLSNETILHRGESWKI